MLQKIQQFINDHNLWSEGWQIFYATLAVALVLWFGRQIWALFTNQLPKFEGDIYDLNFP